MPDQDKLLTRQNAFCETLTEVLGLKLADEVTTKLFNGEDLSLDELSKHHTLTEIGTALIRLNALCPNRCTEDCDFCILGCCFFIAPPSSPDVLQSTDEN